MKTVKCKPMSSSKTMTGAYMVFLGLMSVGIQAEGFGEQIYVGTSGYEFSDSLLDSFKDTRSLAQCGVVCFTFKCSSFTYNKDNSECRIHSRKFCSTVGATLVPASKYYEASVGTARSRCEYVDLMLDNGKYQVFPNPGQSRLDYCYCAADNKVWNVFQYRFDGSVSFYRTWNEYRDGFGSLTGEFWLGNDEIYRLTAGGDSLLRIEMEAFSNEKKYAQYGTFYIDNELGKYKLTIGSYTGTAGNSFAINQNGMFFTTKDRDNDIHPTGNCAQSYTGGYWYSGCFQNNLNGKYKVGVVGGGPAEDSMSWPTFSGVHMSLKVSRMMIRKK